MTKARQNAESAILAAVTALIYTFQLIYGIGTAISYLSVIPLVYAMNRSRSEWLRIVIVSSVVIFAFNDLGGSLFFILFIVPMSVSVALRLNGLPVFLSEGPLFLSLILTLYKFGWIVGFKIPPIFNNWWVILAFLFCAFVISAFSKITYLALRVFDFRPRFNGVRFEFFVMIMLMDLLAILVVYGLSEQLFISLSVVFPLVMMEQLKRSIAEMEKMVVYTFQLLHNKLSR